MTEYIDMIRLLSPGCGTPAHALRCALSAEKNRLAANLANGGFTRYFCMTPSFILTPEVSIYLCLLLPCLKYVTCLAVTKKFAQRRGGRAEPWVHAGLGSKSGGLHQHAELCLTA